jgi:hypothetical protein
MNLLYYHQSTLLCASASNNTGTIAANAGNRPQFVELAGPVLSPGRLNIVVGTYFILPLCLNAAMAVTFDIIHDFSRYRQRFARGNRFRGTAMTIDPGFDAKLRGGLTLVTKLRRKVGSLISQNPDFNSFAEQRLYPGEEVGSTRISDSKTEKTMNLM